MTWIILWVTDRTAGLRVSPGDGQAGLDLSQFAETAYELPGSMVASAGTPPAPAAGSQAVIAK
jgi:hypothetical protein